MTKDKKKEFEEETKAGLMEKNEAVAVNDCARVPMNTEKTPKISKDEAEKRERERPLH